MVDIVNLIGLKSADKNSKGSILDGLTRVFPQRTKGEPVPEWQRHSSLGARGKRGGVKREAHSIDSSPPLPSPFILSPSLLLLASMTGAPPTLDELKPLETKTQNKPLITFLSVFVYIDGVPLMTTHRLSRGF